MVSLHPVFGLVANPACNASSETCRGRQAITSCNSFLLCKRTPLQVKGKGAIPPQPQREFKRLPTKFNPMKGWRGPSSAFACFDAACACMIPTSFCFKGKLAPRHANKGDEDGGTRHVDHPAVLMVEGYFGLESSMYKCSH